MHFLTPHIPHILAHLGSGKFILRSGEIGGARSRFLRIDSFSFSFSFSFPSVLRAQH
jgi:hypothetical protein